MQTNEMRTVLEVWKQILCFQHGNQSYFLVSFAG